MFTLSWVGEWEGLRGTFRTILFIEDITATIGLVSRLVASIIALSALIFYFAKKNLTKPRTYLIIRVVLVLEAIYWLGLFASGVGSVYRLTFIEPFSLSFFNFIGAYVLPAVLESTAIPIALLILAYKLGPNKPEKGIIKWGLISGTVLVLVYWLLNTGMWILTIPEKGTGYLTAYPHNMISFLSTLIGLFALTVYSVYITKKYARTKNLQELNLRPVGVIILGLGLWYLWNYLNWIFFGGNYIWSDWFAWLLGHNMDLWMLSLPLVGLPLLFKRRLAKET